MTLNIVGVQIAATFELFVTILAVGELLVFMGVVAPAFSFTNFAAHGWAGESTFSLAAIGGMFAAIPFAIWFFLAIEGVAMAAEEAKDPKRTIPIAYITGVLTLTVLAFGVMIFAGGSGDWRTLSNLNDPLPQAMKTVVGESSGWLHMLVWLGLFGLVASFHGIIMGYSRQIFAPRPRRLPARFPRQGAPPLPDPACGDRGRRPRWHRRHLQRQPHRDRGPVPHREHRDHGGVRRAGNVRHEHGGPCSSCAAASPTSHVPTGHRSSPSPPPSPWPWPASASSPWSSSTR